MRAGGCPAVVAQYICSTALAEQSLQNTCTLNNVNGMYCGSVDVRLCVV